MKKILVGLIAIVSLIVLFELVPQKGDIKLENEIKLQTAKIEVYYPADHNFSQGTATFLGNNQLVTCAHLVAKNGPSILIMKSYDFGAFVPVVVVSSDSKRDLMILRFNGKDGHKPIKFRTAWKMGENVFLIGNPSVPDFDSGYTKLVGLIYDVNPANFVRSLLVFPEGPAKPGYSGGGVWGMDGSYLGMVEMSIRGTIGLAITASDVQRYIQEHGGK